LQISNIRISSTKRIAWAGEAGVKTPLGVIHIHGFSASAEEMRPVPDKVAANLGANLFFTRLAGHGFFDEAMAHASAGNWNEDMDESMAIGRRLGDRVMILSTSTGGTLAAIAASDPTLALFPMSALVRHARSLNYCAVRAPVLVLHLQADQVADPAQTQALMVGCGSPKQMEQRNMGPQDAPYSHVILGDILGPGRTQSTVEVTMEVIASWAKVQGL
jgi:esterase/lipase